VKGLRLFWAAGLVVAAAASTSTWAQSGVSQKLVQANAALQAGEADKAMALLNELVNTGAKAEALNLRCRVESTLEQWNQAANDCAQAVEQDGQNSNYHLWLARALGGKARGASFLSAFSLAKRARTEFEEAVRLNPRNAEALSDLGEYYYTAPGIVGGGIDKAEGVAERLEKIDPVRGREMRGHIAEQRKDYGTAEREYKQVIASSAHPACPWMALADFYQRRGRWTEMEASVRSGEKLAERDKKAGAAFYDGASVLRATNRDPARAAKMLEEYLASGSKTETNPAFVAHTWLASLKEKLGDAAAAHRERAAALALAHEYKPAQNLKY